VQRNLAWSLGPPSADPESRSSVWMGILRVELALRNPNHAPQCRNLDVVGTCGEQTNAARRP
jgi:hypothetical protein